MPHKKSIHKRTELSLGDISAVIQMAWEDRTTFETIQERTGLSEADVIRLMRHELTPSSFKMWRKRMAGRKTKHLLQRVSGVNRFKCSRQKHISLNKF
jgi:uncharacterized protein (TIGR03643 family)